MKNLLFGRRYENKIIISQMNILLRMYNALFCHDIGIDFGIKLRSWNPNAVSLKDLRKVILPTIGHRTYRKMFAILSENIIEEKHVCLRCVKSQKLQLILFSSHNLIAKVVYKTNHPSHLYTNKSEEVRKRK